MSSETATHHDNATNHHGKHHKTPHNKKSPRKNVDLSLSGYRDSNPGPPTPEAGALTGLRYIPNGYKKKNSPSPKYHRPSISRLMTDRSPTYG